MVFRTTLFVYEAVLVLKNTIKDYCFIGHFNDIFFILYICCRKRIWVIICYSSIIRVYNTFHFIFYCYLEII